MVTLGFVLQLLMAGRKSYDINFKLTVMAAMESKSKEAVARKFKVDMKRVHEWVRPERMPG